MYISNASSFARVNARPVADMSSYDTATGKGQGQAVAKAGNPDTYGLQRIALPDAEVQERWRPIIVNTPTIKPSVAGTEFFRALRLFATVDTQNPSLVTNRDSALLNQPRIAVSPGDGPSALVDLGGDVQVFVVTQKDGTQVAYRVENGTLTTRIPDGEEVDLGSGRKVTGGSDGTPVSFRIGNSSAQLNDDLSQLSVIENSRITLTTYDIASGQVLTRNGVPVLDNMTTQQQFDFYASTTQGKGILNLEGNVYGTDAEKRLFVARVRYLRGEGGAELFSEFTPRRASLSGAELQAYDAEVTKVMNYLREIGVNTINKLPVGGNDNPDQLDESMLYMLASAVVESHGVNPAGIDTVIADVDKRWIVSIDNADAADARVGGAVSTSAGWYNGLTIQVNLKSFVNDYSKPNDRYDILAHELSHSLDYADGSGDGIPNGLSAENAQILRDERARLFALAYNTKPGQPIDLTENQDTSAVVDNSGIRDYAYTNEREFWAVISEQFLSSDGGAVRLMTTSPKLYNLLREYYGRDDLPVAVVS